MNTNDITARQFDTLLTIRLIGEFMEEYPEYRSISEVADNIFEGSIQLTGSAIYRDEFIEDVCALTRHGYIVSDMDEPDDILVELPSIEGITRKGLEVLGEFEQPAKEAVKAGSKFVLFEGLNINISFLGGIETGISMFKDPGGLYRLAAKLFKKK